MNDLQAHTIKKRTNVIVERARARYGEVSRETLSAKRVAESTRRILCARPSEPLPPEKLKHLEKAARIYLNIDGQAEFFYEYLWPRERTIPTWFVLGICLYR